MKNEKRLNCRTVSYSIRKITVRGNIDTPNPHIYDKTAHFIGMARHFNEKCRGWDCSMGVSNCSLAQGTVHNLIEKC